MYAPGNRRGSPLIPCIMQACSAGPGNRPAARLGSGRGSGVALGGTEVRGAPRPRTPCAYSGRANSFPSFSAHTFRSVSRRPSHTDTWFAVSTGFPSTCSSSGR